MSDPLQQNLFDVRKKVFSVGEICRDIKRLLESHYSEGVWIEGEISNLRIPSSGHIYFSLKDADAIFPAAMFKGSAQYLRFVPTDGLKVLVFGAVGIYEGRGTYQIVVSRMEPRGLGALQLAFEQLKNKLAAEGLFDASRKKPLPMLPRRIAIVTSRTGAAIRDVLHVLNRRFSNLAITLYPVLVQGDGASAEMAHAIMDLNTIGGWDLILVTRGGGSLEDLWAFNEEILIRAIAASAIPVVSAVGHEVDTTLCDMVADVRCPTPSAAAEMMVARKQDLQDRVDALGADCLASLENLVERLSHRLQLALRSPGFQESGRLLETYAQKVDDAIESMGRVLLHRWEMAQKEFAVWVGKLNALSPLAVLQRGYSITFLGPSDRIVKKATDARPGDLLKTVLGKGSIFSTVTKSQDQ